MPKSSTEHVITPSRPIGTVTLAIGELNFGSGGTARERKREETVMLLSGMWGKEKYRMNDYYERYVLHPLADTLELCSTCETFCQLFCQFLVLICKLID